MVRLATCLLLIAWAGGCRRTTEPASPAKPLADARRPNVLLISIDTLRADRVGAVREKAPATPVSLTPTLDRLASGGVFFANCRAQATWTLPSHMSLLTSTLPSRSGVDQLRKVLPPDIPTLAELLRDDGYTTAAIVNDGQMRAHWGFDRGFDLWRELPVDTPEGHCDSIVDQAVAWLGKNETPRSDAPYFLFLHFYDPHDPYAAPTAFRARHGVRIDGESARAACFAHRLPDRDLPAEARREIEAAYDAEVAWVDHELSRLFAAVSDDTLIVVLSDHGEAFEEHGWMLHGATQYEEELRVPLIVRLPHSPREAVRVDVPVMLLDIAPTILSVCGLRSPTTHQGLDLSPLWRGSRPDPSPDSPVNARRMIPSESKSELDGRFVLSLTLDPLKAVYSPLDGRLDLFRLPDERTPLADSEAVRHAFLEPLRAWMAVQPYWRLQAVGEGEFEITLDTERGRMSLAVPDAFDAERDQLDLSDDLRRLTWRTYPRGAPRGRTLLLQTEPPDARPRIDVRVNGEPTNVVDLPPSSPFVTTVPIPDAPGLYVRRHADTDSVPASSPLQPLPPEIIRQLRSLGYLQ